VQSHFGVDEPRRVSLLVEDVRRHRASLGYAKLRGCAHAVARGRDGEVVSMAVNADCSHIVTGGAEGTARLSDAARGVAEGKPLRAHDGAVIFVAVSADAICIVSGGSGIICVWDIVGGALAVETLRAQDGVVLSVTMRAKAGHTVSLGMDDEVAMLRAWDLATKK
jgi:WD40 repeat protein